MCFLLRLPPEVNDPVHREPKVCVLMVSWNHERYIEQSVLSVLEQKTSYPFQVILGDDCSTDRTPEILTRLQSAYPDKLRLVLREKNVGALNNFYDLWDQCRGEYLTVLEGDDYWSDSSKLQKQTDAMDDHPEWAICFHRTLFNYEDGSPSIVYPQKFNRSVSRLEDLLVENFMHTTSVMYRHRYFPKLPEWLQKLPMGDWPRNILHATAGDIGFLPETMAVYRVHAKGLWTSTSPKAKVQAMFAMYHLRIDN